MRSASRMGRYLFVLFSFFNISGNSASIPFDPDLVKDLLSLPFDNCGTQECVSGKDVKGLFGKGSSDYDWAKSFRRMVTNGKMEERISVFKDAVNGQNVKIIWNSSDYFFEREDNDLASPHMKVSDLINAKDSPKIKNGFSFFHAVVLNNSTSDVSLNISNLYPNLVLTEEIVEISSSINIPKKYDKNTVKIVGNNHPKKTKYREVDSEYYDEKFSYAVKFFLFNDTNKKSTEIFPVNGFVRVPSMKKVLVKWYAKPKEESSPFYDKVLPTGNPPKCCCPTCGSSGAIDWNADDLQKFAHFTFLDKCPEILLRAGMEVIEKVTSIRKVEIYIAKSPEIDFQGWQRRRLSAEIEGLMARKLGENR